MELRSDDDARYLFDYDAADRLRTESRPDRIERQSRRLLGCCGQALGSSK